ncbi:hypothetical protein AGMMS50268_35110 [Spirochaetia bacterium]|nr:hypothetical protein AGMMS50268_35110 [Spirochaetia bacterium]
MAAIPKTKLVYHEFYSIHDSGDEYHTISFYGTDMRLYSEGAWILDGDYDFGALKNFFGKAKNWEVEEIKIEKGINVEKTVSNIIKKIDSDVTYYFLDHIKDKPDVDNCNTAIKETYAENE